MKYQIIILLAVIEMTTSCVSKKTFMTMQNQYVTQTDSLTQVANVLNAQLESGEADFKSTKHDLMISDAEKNDQIASLEIKLKELQSCFDEVTATLSDTKDLYKVTQSEKDQVSYQMARMNKELVTLRQDTVSINYALKLERKKSATIQKELDEQRISLNTIITENNKEIIDLKKSKESSHLKMMELERQLVLKQKQMDDVNEAFIVLRKELLKAKTQGVAIDPNSNSSINKIAKGLGQY